MTNQQTAEKFLKLYTKTVKDYDDFIEANKAVIVEYEARTEAKRLELFTFQEKIEMLVDEGKVDKGIFLDNDTVELAVRDDGIVKLFEKKLYGTAHLQENKK